jgi:PmbA protein
MEKLLQTAMESVDAAEVYYTESEHSGISTRNGVVTEVGSTMQSGYAIRVLKSGRLGTAYTKNLLDRAELVKNAIASLEGEVEAGFSFPGPSSVASLPVYSPSVESLGFTDLHDACRELLGFFDGRTEGQVDSGSSFGRSVTRIINSNGLDMSDRSSVFSASAQLLFPNTETGIYDVFSFRERKPFPRELLERQLSLYTQGLPEVDITTGRMKVLFHPFSMYTLTWRLSAAASGRSFAKGTTPLLEKVGRKVASDRFTWFDDPLDPDSIGGATPFDDEGTPTRRTAVIENGVFKTIFVNLDYAARLGLSPTGHGYRGGGMWGGNPIINPPQPGLSSPGFAPGNTSFDSMIAGMDKGVILLGVLGAHSGNIINGDFSVGMNPGLYVENGKILGRVRDGMVSGNVWDLLNRVEAIEDRIHNPHGYFRYPCVLLDEVNVSARG